MYGRSMSEIPTSTSVAIVSRAQSDYTPLRSLKTPYRETTKEANLKRNASAIVQK